MKKPNITEGEWSILIKESGYHEIKVGEGRYSPTICSVNPNEYSVDGDKDLAQKNAMANIKAIKEVPNMIDDLIGIVFDYEEGNDLSPAIKKAKETLKNAGVEL